jgi:hypothetical protein
MLTKFGVGPLLLAGTSNTYALGTVINGDALNANVGPLGSLVRNGTPFGSGPITVNPGAILRVADASNISGNVVTVNSDGAGLGGIGLAGLHCHGSVEHVIEVLELGLRQLGVHQLVHHRAGGNGELAIGHLLEAGNFGAFAATATGQQRQGSRETQQDTPAAK